MPLGKDLASIRESQNLTLEDVQNAIKIPVSTLKMIENDSIFNDDVENKTYTRSFIRSYAKLLKLEDEDVVRALDAMEAGNYKSGLLTGTETEDVSEEIISEEDDHSSEIESENAPLTPSPVNSPQIEPKPTSPPTVNTINWADMGKRFTTVGKGKKTWALLASGVVIILLIGGAYIFSDEIGGLFDSNPSDELVMNDDNQNETSTPIDSANFAQAPVDAEVDRTEPEEVLDQQELPPTNITLGDTLTVAVYAAYGQLEPIRVTSDLNWRTNPFWMEEGEAFNFDFQDSLLVRGQYSRFLLLFNGHPIENPRQNHFDSSENSIVITRSILDQQKYLSPPPEEFPLEVGAPDSIVYRIRL